MYCLNKNAVSIYGLLDALKEGRINYIVSVSVQIFRVGLAVYAFAVKLAFLALPLRGGVEKITLRQEVIREVNMPLACAVAGASR